MIPSITVLSLALTLAILFLPLRLGAQSKQPTWQAEWEKTLEAAKREGKVTVSIPASAEMRKQLEENFKRRHGIEVEVFTARDSAAVRRMADVFKAGVRHFDLHIGGSSSTVSGMLDEGILDSIEPWLILPEMRDPKQTFEIYRTEPSWPSCSPSKIPCVDEL